MAYSIVQIFELFHHICSDATLLQNDYAKLIHSKVPVRPSFLALGVTSFTLLFMVWGFGASFVANLIGFVYPLYASFESLQQPRNSAQSQQEKWLVYWVTFGTFSLVESMTDFFLYWIPLYHVAKVAFRKLIINSIIKDYNYRFESFCSCLC